MILFKQIISEHKIAIILALLAAIIVAFPQIYFRIDHSDVRKGGLYQGIELLPDSPWSPRVREIQDGHLSFGSIYYKDGKDNPYLFQPLGSLIVAYMGKTFSLDINNTLLLSRFVLIFIAFLLIYSFVFLLSKDKLIALCGASVLLLAESILSYFGITRILQGISPEDFLRISRPVNPAMIYIIFFSFLIFFWLFYQKRYWLHGIFSAIFLGLNFYNYFYSWTFLYAFGGVLVLIFIIQKKWQEALRVSSVFIGALLLLIPYGMNLYEATMHPAYLETSVRFGVVETRGLLFVGFFVIAALLIFLFLFPRDDKKPYFFVLALLLTPFITLNQQLITGKVLQPAHYHWFFHKPIAVIMIFITFFYLFSRYNLIFYKKLLATLIIAASVFIGVFVQVYSYYYGSNDGGNVAIERQKYGPVVRWLNEYAGKEDVVLSNNEMSHMVVIYTPLNVFYHRAAMYSLSATKERLSDIIFSFYRLRGIGVEDSRETFFKERVYISASIYGMHYRETLGSYEAIPDEKIEEVLESYNETLSIPTPEWLNQTWNRYDVKYIIWDKKNNPEWQLEQYSFLKEVSAFGDLYIYEFQKIEKLANNQ